MIFTPAGLVGAFIIDPEVREDERGHFFRSYCEDEFKAAGIEFTVIQCNVSFNRKKGTVRGMHFQAEPRGEAKLVRCTKGAILDVIIDLRTESPTHRKSISVELSGENCRALFIPRGFGHGFQTLAENTELFYQMGDRYSAEHSSGVRWDDPAFSIKWPLPISVIADKDQNFPDYKK